MDETTKLLSKPSEPKTFYFLNTQLAENQPKQHPGSVENEEKDENDQLSLLDWFRHLFPKPRDGYQLINSTPKARMVPVKVEPKVFFANERTFLAWLHMSVTLASISVAIVA